MPNVKDLMSLHPVSTDPDATLKEVAELMLENDIGVVLVMDGDRLRGLITDRDIVVRAVAFGHDAGTPVRDYLTESPHTIDGDTEQEEAARTMARLQVRRLPVTVDGVVTGIVSLGDLAVKGSGAASEAALEGVSQPTVD